MIRRLRLLALVLPLAAAAPRTPPARDLSGLWIPTPVGQPRTAGLWSATPAPANPRFLPPAQTTATPCPLLGVPWLLDATTRIVQAGDTITMTFPDARDRRSLAIGTIAPAAAPDPADGRSVAQWQGDTLVIHTDTLPATIAMDAAGTRHSAALQVTERWTRLGADRIEVDAVATDRQAFTRAWTSRHAFVRAPWRTSPAACGPAAAAPGRD